MNFPSRPFIFGQIAAKLGNEEETLNVEELTQFREEFLIHHARTITYTRELYEKIAEEKRDFHECELSDILHYLQHYRNYVFCRPVENISEKMLKFFTAQFDERPESQKKALVIYSLLAQSHFSNRGKKITEEEINLIFRMANHYRIQGVESIMGLMLKIETQEPEVIILMIQKCGSLNFIEKLIRESHLGSFPDNLWSIVIDHVVAFQKYADHLKKEGKQIDAKLNESTHHSFLKMAKVCVEQIAKDLRTYQTQNYLSCIVQLYEMIPAFNYFSFQHFYLVSEQIEEDYMEIQDEIAKQLYLAGVLTKLKNIHRNLNQYLGWQKNRIIQTMNIIIKHISVEEFQLEVLPLLEAYLEEQDLSKRETDRLSGLIISFIYINDDLNSFECKSLILKHLLCGIWDKVFDSMKERIARVFFVQKWGNYWEKKQIQTDLNLFYLIVLAFEIIQNCKIESNMFRQSIDLLKNSVQLMNEVLKVEWPKEVLSKFLQNFIEKEEK